MNSIMRKVSDAINKSLMNPFKDSPVRQKTVNGVDDGQYPAGTPIGKQIIKLNRA